MATCPKCGATLTPSRRGGWLCEDCGHRLAREEPAPTAEATGPAHRELDLDSIPFPVAYPLAFAMDVAQPVAKRVDNVLFASYQAMRTTGLLLLADYLSCETTARGVNKAIGGLRQPHWYEWTTLCHQLCRFWSGRLDEKPERTSRFPHLVGGWLEVATSRSGPPGTALATVLAGLPGNNGPAQSAHDALWKARNDRAHRQTTRTEDEGADLALLEQLQPIATRAIARLFPSDPFTLLRRVGNAGPLRVFRLHGPHRDLTFGTEPLGSEWTAVFDASAVAALVGDAAMPVFPFFVAPDTEAAAHPLGGGGLLEPVWLLDAVTDRKVVLLGVRRWGESPALVKPLMAALARKRVEIGIGRDETHRWTLADWAAATARDTVNEHRGRKYFPQCYVERAGVEDALESALEQTGRAVLVLGEAGAGKSSLLARLVDGLTAGGDATAAEMPAGARQALAGRGPADEVDAYLAARGRGDVVLYLSGRKDFEGDRGAVARDLLCNAVLQRAGIRAGAFADLTDFLARLEDTAREDLQADRRVWIVLDAINEADRFTDLVGAVDAVLPAVERHPWLRLIVSMRTGAYQSLARRHRELARHGEEVFANARYWATFDRSLRGDAARRSDARADEQFAYLELGPFDPNDEGPRAYRKRQHAIPERAAAAHYEDLSPAVKLLLCSPLHLHLFHETFRGESPAPADLSAPALFQAYLDVLVAELPGLGGTLRDLGRLMYERRRPELPLETADQWLAQWRHRHDPAEASVKLDPIEELVAASVLMRPAEEGFGTDRRLVGYTFTHQKLCEQVLLGELLRRIAPRPLPSGDELLAWVRHASGEGDGESGDFPELAGALEIVAARLVAAGEGAVLARVLELEHEPVRTRIIGSAIRAMGRLWGPSEQARAGPTGILEAMARAALANSAHGRRLNESVWRDQRWLVQAGYSRAAANVAQVRLTVIRKLVAAEPHRADLQHELSASLNNLGFFARAAGACADARRYFEESLTVIRTLLAAEPHGADLQRNLSVSLSNLGKLAVAIGASAEADRYFDESLTVMRALVATEPQRADLQRNLSLSLNDVGRLAEAAGANADARRHFEESLMVMRALVAAEPHRADFQRDLCVSLNNLGRLSQAAGCSADAGRYFEESLMVMRALVAAEPHRADFQSKLSDCLTDLGRLVEANGAIAEARRHFEESLNVVRALVAAEPHSAELQHDLSNALSDLGALSLAVGDIADARPHCEESLTVMRALVVAEPNRADLQHGLSGSLNRLGRLAHAAGASADAHRYFEESLTVMRTLVAAEPHRADLQRDLASLGASLSNLGQLARSAGATADARSYFEESLTVRRALVAIKPHRADLKRDLSVSLNNLGQLARTAGDSADARRYFDEDLALMRDLVAAEPHRADFQRDLAISCWNLYHAADGPDEERPWLEEILRILRPLRERQVADAQIEKLWTLAERALVGLGEQ